MPRWARLLRAVLLTGATFAIGVGLLTSVIGAAFWVFGKASLGGVAATVARFSLVSCGIGMAFAGLVALTARGRQVDRLSVPHIAGLGAGVGFLYFLLMGVSGAFHAWSLAGAITNLLLVTVTGAGSATAILLLARKGRPELNPGADAPGPPTAATAKSRETG